MEKLIDLKGRAVHLIAKAHGAASEAVAAYVRSRLEPTGCIVHAWRSARPVSVAGLARAVAMRTCHEDGILVGVGGDGTLGAVAAAAYGRELAFGAIPSGTLNYFARSHGIPERPDDAIAALLQSVEVPLPMGAVNGIPFLVHASLGIPGGALEDRESASGSSGRLPFVAFASGMATAFCSGARHDITIEEREGREEVEASALLVCNNSFQLARLGVPQHLRASDGGQSELIGIVARSNGVCRSARVLHEAALGYLHESEEIRCFAFRRLVACPRRGRPSAKVVLDGEARRLGLPFEFEVPRRRLRVLLPAGRRLGTYEG